MIGFIASRLLAMMPTAFLVMVLVAGFIHLIPGDPVDALLGEQALPADRAALRADLGLDKPISTQIATYIKGVVQLDLGESLISDKPIGAMIAARAPATGLLALAAMGVALTFGTLLGVWGALGKPKARKAVDIATLALLATPSFVLGPLLVAGVAVGLNLLPVSGMGGWQSLILPSLTLGTGLGMVLARFLRESLTEAYTHDTLRTAKAKGMGGWRRFAHHALPLALGPVVQITFLQLGMVLTGAILTESVFGWPGLGTLLVEALHQRDYPLMQGCLLIISVTYMLCVLASDVVCRTLDPRLQGGR